MDKEEKDVCNSRIEALLSDLGVLSECNERARGKACASHKDVKNAENS
jgi:hypothetical protein